MMTYLSKKNLVNEYNISYFTKAKIIKMSLLINENKTQRQLQPQMHLALK